jgi:hypothetical protein
VIRHSGFERVVDRSSVEQFARRHGVDTLVFEPDRSEMFFTPLGMIQSRTRPWDQLVEHPSPSMVRDRVIPNEVKNSGPIEIFVFPHSLGQPDSNREIPYKSTGRGVELSL